MAWTSFTRRTEAPKLTWLISALREAGITSRLNGASFHAPILEVDDADLDRGWKILGPVDELHDDDPLFVGVEFKAWWVVENSEARVALATLAGAIGLLAGETRRPGDAVRFSRGVRCHDELVRVERFCLGVSEGLGVVDVDAVRFFGNLRESLVIRAKARLIPTTVYLIQFCREVAAHLRDGEWFTKLAGQAGIAVALGIMVDPSGRDPESLLRAAEQPGDLN